jgi:putative ABC transport system permease protein
MLIWKMALKGIKAHKSYSITLFILILIVSLFSSVALDVLFGGSRLWNEAYNNTDTPTIDYIYHSERYKYEYLAYFRSKPEVESAKIIPGLLIEAGQCKLDSKETNNFFGIFQMNETLTGNECIVPYGMKSSSGVALGSVVTIKSGNSVHNFKVTGFEIDPLYGDQMTVAKRFGISPSAYDKLSESAAPVIELAVYLNADVDANQFSSEFPGTSATFIASTRDRAHSYALTIPNMVSYFLLSVAVLMVLVGLLVIRHAILAALESDYKTFGILKGLGFSGKQTVSFILLQYMLIAMTGAVLGIALSIPLATPVMDLFIAPAGIPAHPIILPPVMAAVAALIGALAFATAWLNARRVTKVSPVRAIAVGTAPIHFSSRFNPPLRLLGLLPRGLRLAVKQMASRAGQYVLVAVICCIFSFLLITTLGFHGAIIGTESAGMMFGFSKSQLYFQNRDDTNTGEIISFLNDKRKIETTFVQSDGNGEINGNMVFIRAYDDYERVGLASALSGRYPKFNNEVAITPRIRDIYHLSIGDIVTLGDGNAILREYIITGIISNPIHMGEVVLTTLEGLSDYAGRGNITSVRFEENLTTDETKQIIDKASNEFESAIFGNMLQELDDLTQSMRLGVAATIGLILGLTIFLILLITILVSLIAIYRERADMGIFKTSGYSVKELRWQFSLRFLITSVIGAAIGLCGGFLLSDGMMSVGMSLAGVSSVVIEKTFFVMTAPLMFVIGLTTLSAWFATRHIKRIDARRLTVE